MQIQNAEIKLVNGNLVILSTLAAVCPGSDFVPCQVSVQIGSRLMTFSRKEFVKDDGVLSAVYQEPVSTWLLKLAL